MQELNREANTLCGKISGRGSIENFCRAESADRADAGTGAEYLSELSQETQAVS